MFTWICPACGKEVPPHETECPHCHGTGKLDEPKSQPDAPAQQPAAASPPPSQAASSPPQPAAASPAPPEPAAAPPAPPQQQQPQRHVITQKRGMPGWLVTLIVAAVVIGLGALAYYYVLPSNRPQPSASNQQESPFEAPQEAAPVGQGIARHIEVTGFRITEEEGQRPVMTFLVVNHSAADIGDLAGKVTLVTTEDPDRPITTFDFRTSSLGPYESIEFKNSISTKLRAYEMPDWQFLRPIVEITSPKEL